MGYLQNSLLEEAKGSNCNSAPASQLLASMLGRAAKVRVQELRFSREGAVALPAPGTAGSAVDWMDTE